VPPLRSPIDTIETELMKRIPLVVLVLFATAAPCAAQKASAAGAIDRMEAHAAPGAAAVQAPTRVWGGVGLSIGTVGIGAGFDVAMLRGEHLFSGRFTVQGTVSAGGNNNAESITVSEAGVMYGRGMHFPGGNWGSVSGGIALVAGDRDDVSFETVGIPLQAQLISRRMPHLGATLAANLNADVPFVSFILSLQVGRVP
jgi:hypothetical protein